MPLENGSFATAGATPGSAAGWTSSFVSSVEQFADFARNSSDAGTLALESFELGWAAAGDQVFAPELGEPTIGFEIASFNLGPGQIQFENFDVGWGSPPLHQDELSSIDFAVFAGEPIETFDAGWGAIELALPAPTAALFAGAAEERFETGWAAAFENSLDAFTLESATTETFESVIAPIAFTANVSDTMTLAASSPVALADDQVVSVANAGGSLPSPLDDSVSYYLRSVSGNTFKLSPNAGGPPIDLTDIGTGVHTLRRDPAAWWSRLMTTV